MTDAPKPSITEMKLDLPAGAAPVFDAGAEARAILRAARTAALATNDPESGHPLATLVTVATAIDGAPLLLLSGLSVHTRNLVRDPRASLLMTSEGKGDPLAHPRLSLVGSFARSDAPDARRRFLAKHPKSKLYVELPDFAFFRMTVTGVHFNGGFARAAKLGPDDVILDMTDAESLAFAEESAVAHMNADHLEAVDLYARVLAKAGEGSWHVTGVDPEGLDLAAGDRTARVAFPRRVSSPGVLAKVLKALADDARAMTVR